MNSGSQLPPPPSGSTIGADASTSGPPNKMITAVAVLGLTATAFLTFLWLGERAAKNDAIDERNAARAALDGTGSGGSGDASADLAAAQSELIDVRADLEAARVELEAARTEDPDGPDVAVLEAQLAEERAEVDRLEAEISDLEAATTADSSESEPSTETEPEAPTDAEPEPDAPDEADTTTDAEPEPDVDEVTEPIVEPTTERTALEIGTDLGGLYRQNVLGVGQRRCLGERVLGIMGDDVETILASESPETNQELFEVLLGSTAPCAIAQSALFG